MCLCVRVRMCVAGGSLVSGSPEHAGTAGQRVYDPSIWSLPEAHAALLCCVSVFVCLCVS